MKIVVGIVVLVGMILATGILLFSATLLPGASGAWLPVVLATLGWVIALGAMVHVARARAWDSLILRTTPMLVVVILCGIRVYAVFA